MEEQTYGDDIITITDEDGTDYVLEVLASTEYNGAEYIAVTPADAPEDDEAMEVSVLKYEEEDGEMILVAVEDEDELEKVYNILLDVMDEEEYEEDEE